MKDILIIVLFLCYAGFLVGGTTYLVGWMGWSPLWYILTILLMPSLKWNS